MPEQANPKLRSFVPAAPERARAEGARSSAYAELAVASNYSFLRGASYPDELVYRAAELGYRAIAITDWNTMAGVVRAHVAAKEAGIKLLVGARLRFVDAPDLLVWAPDRASYARLCRLLTLGKRRTEKGQCELRVEDFLEGGEGLVAAVVGDCGLRIADCGLEITNRESQIHNPQSAIRNLKSQISDLKSACPSLSLAVACSFGGDDAGRLEELALLSRTFDVPLLAVNDVHYHDPSRRMHQDLLVCIREGCSIQQAGFKLFPNGERYLKPPEAMHRLFAEYPQAIRRGLEIAERCSFSLDELRYEYPDEVVPEGKTAIQHLSELAWSGAATRYPGGVPEKVRGLIEHELVLIEKLKYEAYFLTVYDLVKFARSRGILCQGRGSAANSAVCYCIGVTSVDPARIDLLFERFVSAARNEPPDIDIDFEHERREEVLQYLYEKYGRERAGLTAEVISYRGRSAVRDVGKALGLGLDLVDQMAKKLEWWDRGTIGDEQLAALGIDPHDGTIRRLVDLTSQILGFPRHLSQHVGGMVMTRGPLCEMVPIENAAMDGRTVIEWDKDDIDALGILKVDCLGLGMLTCISKCLAFVNGILTTEAQRRREEKEDRGLRMEDGDQSSSQSSTLYPPSSSPLCLCASVVHPPLELHTVPPEDPAVYEMISNADTIGVFQIESRAQMSMLPRLRPKCFYDLVIEVAIVRPGPIQGDMVHPYLRRRNGEEPVSYPSEALRGVLSKTLGVPLFQEQAMKLAMVGAGFSAEEADQLRRAMAAWKRHGALEKFRPKFIGGMLANGYQPEFAEKCFQQLKGFADYGFPESHAASFALLVYVSAWLKHYYPAAFAASLLNSQPMGFYAPAQIVRDARQHGVEVRAVDVNASEGDCTLEDRGLRIEDSNGPSALSSILYPPSSPALRLGFRIIRGMPSAAAERIVTARRRVGRFESIAQLQKLADLPRRVVELLAEADAFGSLGLSRRQAMWQAMELADDEGPLFGEKEEGRRMKDERQSAIRNPQSEMFLPTMPLSQEVMADYATAGLSLKRHPVALVRENLSGRGIITSDQLGRTDHGRWVKVAGVVLVRQRPGTAGGIVFQTIEDETGIVNLIIKPDVYDRYRLAAKHGAMVIAEGRIQRVGQVIHVMVRKMEDVSNMLQGYRIISRNFH